MKKIFILIFVFAICGFAYKINKKTNQPDYCYFTIILNNDTVKMEYPLSDSALFKVGDCIPISSKKSTLNYIYDDHGGYRGKTKEKSGKKIPQRALVIEKGTGYYYRGSF